MTLNDYVFLRLDDVEGDKELMATVAKYSLHLTLSLTNKTSNSKCRLVFIVIVVVSITRNVRITLKIEEDMVEQNFITILQS